MIDLKDYVSALQYEVYWKDVEKSLEEDIHGWACGFYRNLFLVAPPIDEIQPASFMEYMADRAAERAHLHRTLDQSVVCSVYERTADERHRREFFAEPLKKAHFYNEFKGVHVIDLTDWVLCEQLDFDPDFNKLRAYMINEQQDTRFILWVRTKNDVQRLSRSIPGLSIKQIQLPSPSIEQVKYYASISMQLNNLAPTENAIQAMLQGIQEPEQQINQFKRIAAAIAFLTDQVSNTGNRKPTKTDVRKLQLVMEASYVAEERPVKKIGFTGV